MPLPWRKALSLDPTTLRKVWTDVVQAAKVAVSPAADTIPQAGETGTLALGWIPPLVVSADTLTHGLNVAIYADASFTGTPTWTTVVTHVSASPGTYLRFHAYLWPMFSEVYTLTTSACNHVRLTINGTLLISSDSDSVGYASTTYYCNVGVPLDITIDYWWTYQYWWGPSLGISWSSASQASEAVPDSAWTTTGAGVRMSDVLGPYRALEVVAIRGREVAATAPTDQQALVWDATSATWGPGTAAGGASSLDGDLSGTTGSASVVKLQGRAVATTAPTDQQALVWDAASSTWGPGSVSSGTAAVTTVQLIGVVDGVNCAFSLPTPAIPSSLTVYTDTGGASVAVSFTVPYYKNVVLGRVPADNGFTNGGFYGSSPSSVLVDGSTNNAYYWSSGNTTPVLTWTFDEPLVIARTNCWSSGYGGFGGLGGYYIESSVDAMTWQTIETGIAAFTDHLLPVSSPARYWRLVGQWKGWYEWSATEVRLEIALSTDTTTEVILTTAPSVGTVLLASYETVLGVGGDLSGTTRDATVTKLQGRAVATTAPSDGDMLVWNDAASQWLPTNTVLYEDTLSSAADGWTFPIPASCASFEIELEVRVGAGDGGLRLYFNGDTTDANYFAAYSNKNYVGTHYASSFSSPMFGYVHSNGPADYFEHYSVRVPDVQGSRWKRSRIEGEAFFVPYNGENFWYLIQGVITWKSAAAITTVTVKSGAVLLAAGSHIRVVSR